MISGGTLLAGLLMLSLASPSARWRAARLAAAGVCVAVWVPLTANALQHQRDGSQGFREADNALIYQLGSLPQDKVVLRGGRGGEPVLVPAADDDRLRRGRVDAAARRHRLDVLLLHGRGRGGLAAAPAVALRGGERRALGVPRATARRSGTTRRTACRTRRRST